MTNQDLNKAIKTIVKVKEIKGTSFVGVRAYENKQGEISNQTFLVGFSYAQMLKKDLNKLISDEVYNMVETLKADNDSELVAKAYNELITSLEKRTASEEEKEKLRLEGDKTIKLSDAQKDAFTPIAKGLKAKDNALYIYGLCVRKTILQKGEYKQTKSQKKTIIKNKIKKFAELKDLKYKQFKLGNLEELKIQGATI